MDSVLVTVGKSRFLTIGLIVISIAACQMQPVKPENAFDLLPGNLKYSASNQNGYRSLIPARSDFGPLFVFHGSVNQNEISFDKVVCQNLYPNVTPSNPTIILSNSAGDQSKNFGFTLDALKGLIGTDNSASFDASYKNSSKYTLTLGSATDSYVSGDSLWKNGNAITVDPSCKSSIADLKLKGQFQNSVFIVTRAAGVQGLSYTFSKDNAANADLTVKYNNLINAHPKAGWTSTDSGSNTTVATQAVIHIGVVVEAVDSWVPSGAVAADGATQAVLSTHEIPGSYSVKQ